MRFSNDNSLARAQLSYDNMVPEDETERRHKEEARLEWEEENADRMRDEELDRKAEEKNWGGI